jgi:methylated-DNA-[protein]-cysteine S-methyltransferase
MGAGANVMTLFTTRFFSPVGALTLVSSDDGLRALVWENERAGRVPLPCTPVKNAGHPVLAEAARQLAEYFVGQRMEFTVPLDLRGTPFQLRAWAELAKIPFGATLTYGEQARRMGCPDSVRAVGAANGRNPVSIIIPCHRVAGADGRLTGFAGGVDAKRWLLDWEARIVMEANGGLRLTG